MVDQKLSEEPAAQGDRALQDILNTVKLPSGFARLTPGQRRKLIAAILATVIPSDGKLREVEIKHYVDHLKHKYQFTKDEQKVAMRFFRHGLTADQLKMAAKQLQELLSADDRAKLVGMMWDVAMSDHELHPEELRLIYSVADIAGVAKSRVLEEQARAASATGLAAIGGLSVEADASSEISYVGGSR